MKNKKKVIGIVLGIIVVIVVGVFVYLNQTVSAAVPEYKIMKGVSCDGISLSGMTKDEAKKVVEEHIDELHQQKITMYVDDESATTKVENLGVMADAQKTVERAYKLGRSGSIFTKYSQVTADNHEIKLYRTYDEDKFLTNIVKVTKKIITAPKNASLKRNNGKFKVIKEKTGYTLKKEETFDSFKKAVEANEDKALLVVKKENAKYTSEDMEKVKDKLGTYTTYYGSSAYGRKANVANGAKKINGTVLYPGESFSVYKQVSPFTAANGYALAGSYENGQTVQTYGGGICQVSTTLYNAAIRAELDIKERHPHSMTVSYVPRSSDAAIAGTSKDLKFKNQYDFPIYILGKSDGSALTFTVYGLKKDKNRKVTFESETTSVRSSGGTKIIKDASLYEGKRVLESYGHTGYTARLWKIVTVNGKQQSRKIFNKSSYMATPSTYRVGTKKKPKKEKKEKKKDTKKATTEKKKTTTEKKKD